LGNGGKESKFFRKCDERRVRSESPATIAVLTPPQHGPPQRILDVPLERDTLWLFHHISARFLADLQQSVPIRRGLGNIAVS
jgi:hypothetical protein